MADASTADGGSPRVGPHILVVDSYDSFVFNLVQYLQQLGARVTVRRNDQLDPAWARSPGVRVAPFDGMLLSPGPGDPASAGQLLPLVTELTGVLPILGVCLGHQAIGEAFGAVVSHAPELRHGKTSLVSHDGRGVFDGLPGTFTATRYHSLAVRPETLRSPLQPTAWTESGVLMGLRHGDADLEGVQFHPESVLTEHGHLMLANWLARCGGGQAVSLAPRLGRHAEQVRRGAAVAPA